MIQRLRGEKPAPNRLGRGTAHGPFAVNMQLITVWRILIIISIGYISELYVYIRFLIFLVVCRPVTSTTVSLATASKLMGK
jgi:hypothetical protein